MPSEHGTNTRYSRGCRCRPCLDAMSAHRRAYEADKRRGEVFRVSPDKARKHAQWLLDNGLSKVAVARASGLTSETVRHLIKRTHGFITAETQDAVLGVSLSDATMQPGWKVRLMVAHMQRAGVSTAQIAAALKTRPDDVRKYLMSETHEPRTLKRFTLIYRYLAEAGRVPAAVLEEIA